MPLSRQWCNLGVIWRFLVWQGRGVVVRWSPCRGIPGSSYWRLGGCRQTVIYNYNISGINLCKLVYHTFWIFWTANPMSCSGAYKWSGNTFAIVSRYILDICDMIKGNEPLVENFNSYFLAPLPHNFNMLHFYSNLITNGYLVTELWRICQC